MKPIATLRQYSVQKTPLARKEKISTIEPFEVLILKYYSVKMLS